MPPVAGPLLYRRFEIEAETRRSRLGGNGCSGPPLPPETPAISMSNVILNWLWRGRNRFFCLPCISLYFLGFPSVPTHSRRFRATRLQHGIEGCSTLVRPHFWMALGADNAGAARRLGKVSLSLRCGEMSANPLRDYPDRKLFGGPHIECRLHATGGSRCQRFMRSRPIDSPLGQS